MRAFSAVLGTGALLAASAALAGVVCGDQDPPLKPNVLLVVVDDVAERDIDSIPTPVFDGLAGQGVRFSRAYAAPTCAPSRWQWRFGEFQGRAAAEACAGSPGGRPEPPPGLLSMAVVLEGANYDTALFGKWHLGTGSASAWGAPWELAPRAHGFATARAWLPGNILAPTCPGSFAGTSHTDWYRVDDTVGGFSSTYTTTAILDAFLAWHAARSVDDEPWFAEVSFQAPHKPWEAPPGTTPPPSPTDRELYELMLTDVDAALGSMLAAVDLEDTLVIVMGDNGTPLEVLGAGQQAGKVKSSTFEDGIRVPLVVAGPGVAVGGTCDLVVSLVDLLPTLAELASVSIGPRLGRDGHSLVATLADPSEPIQRPYAWAGQRWASNDYDYAVVDAAYKYRETRKPQTPVIVQELYDLTVDPSESNNLALDPAYAGVVAALRPLLLEHAP